MLQLCAEFVLQSRMKEFKEKFLNSSKSSADSADARPGNLVKLKQSGSSGFISMFDKSPSAFYCEISEYFGDSLCVRLPEIPELKSTVFKPSNKEVNMSFSDSEANKSGEQLLDELMEQIKQEKEASRKKKEREKYLKDKQERDQLERIERRKQEQEMRLADQRQQLFLRKQRQAALESDDEIDVEGDDKSDNSLNSDRSEEDGAVDSDISVKSSIGAPGQGIKLTFTKRSKLTLGHAPQFEDSPLSDSYDMGDTVKKGKKRKHGSTSPQEMTSSLTFNDIVDFGSSSRRPQTSTYSTEGEQVLRSHHKKFY